MFYKSREFCKVADCTNQKFLDDPECPESTKVFLKEKSCPECFAHRFHAYLQKEGYSIVKLPGMIEPGGVKVSEILNAAYVYEDGRIVTHGQGANAAVWENKEDYEDNVKFPSI